MNHLIFRKLLIFVFFTYASTLIFAQQLSSKNRWNIGKDNSIFWYFSNADQVPYKDNIEMAGRKVAGIISYDIDSAGFLTIDRHIFFPQFHPYLKSSDPNWYIYRAYEKEHYGDDILPDIIIDEKQLVLPSIQNIDINGMIHFKHTLGASGLQVVRSFFPSVGERAFVEKWKITNVLAKPVDLKVGKKKFEKQRFTKDGNYYVEVTHTAKAAYTIQPTQSIEFAITIKARAENESYPTTSLEKTYAQRREFLTQMQNSLQLNTPNAVLNQLFEFSKIRASESIFDSKLGLIHSPGGGRYYLGIWANDQAEYVSPFFPYLGYDIGNESAMNCYRAFASATSEDYENIRYAFEIEGEVPPFRLDRGDAAMIAYGAAQFALASGNKKAAKELWGLIQWCLEYCHRQLNDEGVVQSQSDEMEGRIKTGTANLATASLYYGALVLAKDLAKSLGQPEALSNQYATQAETLRVAIENYFGAEVEGLKTYKYYQQHQHLRHWICLPLVVGIFDRKEATVNALFEKLWTPNGVHVEKNSDNPAIAKIFWDRGTLYALRGTFLAGATEVSLEKLIAFSEKRLLGDRVPYVVEAYPEGNMAHLSAESGLYCRVFTEGMFGIVPTGLHSFQCTPRLPEDWSFMELNKVKAFGKNFNLKVSKKSTHPVLKIEASKSGKVLLEKSFQNGDTIHFSF
ncbi:MAG: six-hairpin glycosidase-like protein [Bacteroidota bacterium]